jgi:cell fate regulator YaaT (PSP1 superfamily)
MTDPHETCETDPPADTSAEAAENQPTTDPASADAGPGPDESADADRNGAPSENADASGDVGGEGRGDGGGNGGNGGEAAGGRQTKTARRDKPTLVIRYGRMRHLGRFRYSLDRWRRGQRAVIKSDRGIEIGTIVCRAIEGCCGDDLKVKGEVLRLVTHSDEVDERHLEKDADREFAFCKERIAARNLPMKLVAVEHLFGGDRIIFYFVAEKRVDFRALVRDLAREFQTRIEMRQIGVRDEARLLGDYERCGRPLCCRAFIRDLEPVSMKMAKVQKATLDPSKISGRCGRLMCCLRFEHATYRELQKNLPRKGKVVGTAVGRGKVVDTDVVTQTATVLLEGGTRVVVPVETLVAPEEAGSAAGTEAGQHRGGESKKDGGSDRAKRRDEGRRDKEEGGSRKDGGSKNETAKEKAAGSKKDGGDKKRGRRKRRRSKGKRRSRNNAKSGGSKSNRGSGGKGN